MAKSKHKKQEEAIERARKRLPIAREIWMKHQPGGSVYEGTAKHNKNYADQIMLEAQKCFEEAAARAHTDLHGNPL